MTSQELATSTTEKIPFITATSTTYLGMVRQWQELFYEERYSQVYPLRRARLRGSSPRPTARSACAPIGPKRLTR